MTTESIDWAVMTMGLVGGLAIFLLGMDRTVSGFRALAGDRVRWLLTHTTGNRWRGTATGAGVTAIIQSSSVTTVLLVGLISAGVMSLEQSIGVIFGASVGTTVTAQIIAFKVTRYALAVVAVGYAIQYVAKQERLERIGQTITGLGLVFFGMSLMGLATDPLQDSVAFRDFLASIDNLFIGMLIGAVFTAIVQSSSASIAVFIAMAATGLITLDLGVALVLGANIGTTITPWLASIGKPRDAQRAALIHTSEKVIGVLLWLPFIGVLIAVSERLSPAGDVARQIAWAHTVFNVVNLFILIWFTSWFARMSRFVLKDRPEEEARVLKARFLNEDLLRTPSLALERSRMEIARMGGRVRDMFELAIPAVIGGSEAELATVEAMDDEVDDLYGHIIAYLGKASQEDLTHAEVSELLGLMEAANDIEAIGDAIETNLVTRGRRRLQLGVTISPETTKVIDELAAEVLEAVDIAVGAVGQSSPEAAQRAIGMKSDITSLTAEALSHQMERLTVDEPLRVEAYRVESDIIEDLKRVYYYAKRAARVGVPKPSEEERPSEG